VTLRPHEGHLIMHQMLHADEIRPIQEVPAADGSVKPAELKLARDLINQLAAERFEPAKGGSRSESRPEPDRRKGGRAGGDPGARGAAASSGHRPDGGVEGQPRAARHGGRPDDRAQTAPPRSHDLPPDQDAKGAMTADPPPHPRPEPPPHPYPGPNPAPAPHPDPRPRPVPHPNDPDPSPERPTARPRFAVDLRAVETQ